MTPQRHPPDRFVDPLLPPRFVLIASDGSRLGPFDRGSVITEPDGAIVFYEDGALPMRLGVVGQDGEILHLHPTGSVRVLAFGGPPRTYAAISMPSRFVLEVQTEDGEWIDHGLFGREDFARLDDGSYVCAGHGGAPVFLRCRIQIGDEIESVDGSGAAISYRLVPFPSDKYGRR